MFVSPQHLKYEHVSSSSSAHQVRHACQHSGPQVRHVCPLLKTCLSTLNSPGKLCLSNHRSSSKTSCWSAISSSGRTSYIFIRLSFWNKTSWWSTSLSKTYYILIRLSSSGKTSCRSTLSWRKTCLCLPLLATSFSSGHKTPWYLHPPARHLHVSSNVPIEPTGTCRMSQETGSDVVSDKRGQAAFVVFAGTWSICCACRYLIQFTKNKEEYEWRGYMYAALLLVTAMLQSVFLHQYFHSCLVLGMRLRSVIISAVYRKVHCCCCWTLSAVEVIDTHTVLKRTLVLMRSDSFEVQFLLHSFRINYIKDGVIQTCKLYSSRWMYF